MTARRLPKPFTPGELATLRAASRPDVRALVDFLAETGLRQAEALSITAAEARTWRIVRRGILRRAEPCFTTIVGKGAKERVVAISPEAVRAAAVLLGRPSRNGRAAYLVPWSSRGVNYVFEQLSATTGIHAHPHRCRHTFATDMVEAGVSVDTVADMLGHASTRTTRIYEESSRRRRAEAISRRRRWARRAR